MFWFEVSGSELGSKHQHFTDQSTYITVLNTFYYFTQYSDPEHRVIFHKLSPEHKKTSKLANLRACWFAGKAYAMMIDSYAELFLSKARDTAKELQFVYHGVMT